ncbi:NADH dehydrogenase (ubiquinone) Fe-S protein 1 [[Emmonsia] crescens]|uniref:NADH dehydrogenase (Ubiquinone) Fe-S protein 1 n=1 Tax=[Emmonsia] crescens TaxID=73230 RepID=A0A0G2JC59_9EURO|nr:NADH dehydrogenase (ubiquinone) Fe-S protein 1 [Emmonsia crescens UAMH 3008]
MLRDRMEMISPALRRYDVVENTSSAMSALSKVQLVDQNRGAAVGNQPFRRVVENFYFTDSISRSSPTMARCSAAKETGNPDTNFMIGSAVEEQQRLDGASRA